MQLFFYNTSKAQINKSCADSCGKGIYWIEGNNEKVGKDSIAITGYIKIVSGEILPAAPFSAIYFNDKKILTDGNGRVYIRLPKGEYQICAFSGGAYSLSAKKNVYTRRLWCYHYILPESPGVGRLISVQKQNTDLFRYDTGIKTQ